MLDSVSAYDDGELDNLKSSYVDALALIERLHRKILDVIKDEFDREGRTDINPVQAFLLFNLGEGQMSAGELKDRGAYLGSNISYNIKKLADRNFINHEKSIKDRRTIQISLTEKGREVARIVDDLCNRHVRSVEKVGDVSRDDFELMNKSLKRLERFWTDQILYRL